MSNGENATTSTTYVKNLVPGDLVIFEGKVEQIADVRKADTGYMVEFEGGYDAALLGYTSLVRL